MAKFKPGDVIIVAEWESYTLKYARATVASVAPLTLRTVDEVLSRSRHSLETCIPYTEENWKICGRLASAHETMYVRHAKEKADISMEFFDFIRECRKAPNG